MANYRDVLMPTQAIEMERFLTTLTKGAELCRQAEVRPDILAAMRSWGNIPMTAKERGITEAFKKREKKAKMRRKRAILATQNSSG